MAGHRGGERRPRSQQLLSNIGKYFSCTVKYFYLPGSALAHPDLAAGAVPGGGAAHGPRDAGPQRAGGRQSAARGCVGADRGRAVNEPSRSMSTKIYKDLQRS